MVSQEQAEKFVEKLTELIEENVETNNTLIKKSYVTNFENAKISIGRRIANGEFPTIAALRKKFGVTASKQ
ncbi:hypothetical protein LE191_04095 [Janthinobacterium sp. HSC-3S05]|uniref:hypothetical protein n=1 Tax=Janthinobacterium lividum TaxID=29581 RepID=UPI001CD85344|nr:hypothetical protein [Janthinobacterium lividum]MCA1859290.1 hypothetical protein [Janthinobacterium lividum]